MDKKRVLAIGSTGLVGSFFVERCKEKFQILTAGRTNCNFEIDLLNEQPINSVIKQADVTYVLNFAAFTNVDEAESEKDNINGDVYKLNVLAPLYLAKACQKENKKLIHISTDYVFDGRQNDQPYKETDTPNPLGWYAQTKYEGELKVLNTLENSIIIRIALPFSGSFTKRLDVGRAVIERLKNNQEYFGITDQKVTPSNVLDIANGLSLIIEKDLSGIFHLTSKWEKGYISPFDFAIKIAETFNLDKSLIKPITFEEFSKTRPASRPQHTWLNTTKIESIGMRFLTEEESMEDFLTRLQISADKP